MSETPRERCCTCPDFQSFGSCSHADSSPPPAPSPATTPDTMQVQDQGWTKKSEPAAPNQQQEPELKGEGPVCARCPVCNGMGQQSRPPSVAGDATSWTAAGSETYPCPACHSTGVVWRPQPAPERLPPGQYRDTAGALRYDGRTNRE